MWIPAFVDKSGAPHPQRRGRELDVNQPGLHGDRLSKPVGKFTFRGFLRWMPPSKWTVDKKLTFTTRTNKSPCASTRVHTPVFTRDSHWSPLRRDALPAATAACRVNGPPCAFDKVCGVCASCDRARAELALGLVPTVHRGGPGCSCARTLGLR